MIVDSHTHVYMEDYDGDLAAMMERSREAGVRMMILPGVEPESLPRMERMCRAYPDVCRMAVGLHPTELGEDVDGRVAAIERYAREHREDIVAIGEVGVDLYHDATRREEQMDVFRRMCQLALELGKPVIIHCREALEEVLTVLESLPAMPRGVFHSFGGSAADVEAIRRSIGRGWLFGINGVVTFKNSRLRETLPTIGLGSMLVETDAPWLAPVPLRGKRNEPAYMANTVRHIAECLGESYETVADRTTANALSLFGINAELPEHNG